ncbi:MAG: reverse transcriptase/maturase family protein [Candidatus Symbiothrix sp.]|jgi:retron-type reverse transcriptase|nr:reverse transcriptase/maturase family protein [Candidatus Symbiothrix sp.]
MLDENQLLCDLFTAYYDARRHKRSTMNQLKFEINYEHNLVTLLKDLCDGTYRIRPSICFIVTDPVKREILAADFRDRVIHHLLYNYINPLFEQVFVEDSYSCRKEKGTLYGIKRVESFIKECSQHYTTDCYVLKLDIRGYFMNINKEILSTQIKSQINSIRDQGIACNAPALDWDLIFKLIDQVVWDDPTDYCIIKGKRSNWDGLPPSKSLFGTPKGCGLPIGNLTSQLFSNVYLHPFDDYMKHTLGLKYYGRYVDDFVVVHEDKEFLKEVKCKATVFLKEQLGLDLHPDKIYLQHHSKGVKFLGAYLKPGRKYVAKRTKTKFVQCVNRWEHCLATQKNLTSDELKNMRAGINSYLGLLRHYETYNLRHKYLLKGAKNAAPLFFNYGVIHVKNKKMTFFLHKFEKNT